MKAAIDVVDTVFQIVQKTATRLGLKVDFSEGTFYARASGYYTN